MRSPASSLFWRGNPSHSAFRAFNNFVDDFQAYGEGSYDILYNLPLYLQLRHSPISAWRLPGRLPGGGDVWPDLEVEEDLGTRQWQERTCQGERRAWIKWGNVWCNWENVSIWHGWSERYELGSGERWRGKLECSVAPWSGLYYVQLGLTSFSRNTFHVWFWVSIGRKGNLCEIWKVKSETEAMLFILWRLMQSPRHCGHRFRLVLSVVLVAPSSTSHDPVCPCSHSCPAFLFGSWPKCCKTRPLNKLLYQLLQ